MASASPLPDRVEKLRPFLDFSPDAVLVIEPEGNVVLTNAQTEALFGYPSEELVGQPVEVLLPERFRSVHARHRTAYLAKPRTRPMGVGLELFGLRKDGREFPVDISLHPLETEDGTLFVAAIRDVTERRRLEAFRDQFIASAAHELRTPLAAIGMAAQLLTEGDRMTEEDRESTWTALLRQCARATLLVSNLLDLSTLETGRFSLQLEEVDLTEIVARVLSSAPRPEGVTVATRLDTTRVVTDPSRLEQVLTNLLSNAFRYGGRQVRIEASSREGRARISVSDDGQGVAADLIPTMFEPFTRGKTAGAVGGSGLGLAVCRRIVEVQGGEIWYETSQPHGARLVVELPCVE